MQEYMYKSFSVYVLFFARAAKRRKFHVYHLDLFHSWWFNHCLLNK